MMYQRLLIFICKVLIKFLRLFGSSGSALPGLIIEKLNPSFLDRCLKDVQKKIILVTGTNGKTTTTKMIVAALRGSGSIVITNSSGSNMTRGLIAALTEDMTYFGSLKSTDWFVFEMDEAYAPIFTKNIKPRIVVGLNVLRDQLDRYGELDNTARFIEEAALQAGTFVYNEHDPLLKASANVISSTTKTKSFGVESKLIVRIKNEQTLTLTDQKTKKPKTILENVVNLDGQKLTISESNSAYFTKIPVQGFHNALNATAALSTLKEVLDDEKLDTALLALSKMPIPFGRGELLKIKNKSIIVALVKNPSGFLNNLETFVKTGKPDAIYFVINDNIADGRDVSWLWDVDFGNCLSKTTPLIASGIRAYDMAVRLKHDGYSAKVIPNVAKMVSSIVKGDEKKVVIIPTYTALFEVRSELSKYGKVPRIW